MTGHDADGHADVLEDVEQEHGGDPCDDQRPKPVRDLIGQVEEPQDQHEVQRDDEHAPDKAHGFRRDGEDEVRVLFRHEVELADRALLEQALARDLPGATAILE